MKLKFDSNLNYQNEAIKAVTDLFDGETTLLGYFDMKGQTGFDTAQTDGQDEQKFGQGIGNKKTISDDDILENLRKVQKYHKLDQSTYLNGLDLNIEMETGTGKTYVYLKTIFELNKLYNFTKFIIVVPSIAIKEGVYKTIEITQDHFKGLYDNVVYDYFVYDSSKLEQVRSFAVNSNIEIMIINIDAFNKCFTASSFDETKKTNATNIIHRPQDKLSGYKPIDLIAATDPIVIIDEPQSVMGGKGEEAVSYLNPLCTLRYSATHREIQNLVYKLDAVDAYDMKLVKEIEVASITSENDFNDAYVKLISVSNKNNKLTAKIEINAYRNGSTSKKQFTVRQGDELASNNLSNSEIYDNYRIGEINCTQGNEYMELTPVGEYLKIGQVIGGVDDLEVKRAQIRKTIEEHLDKELYLNKDGIKVLSLFFIDKVSNYREYDEDGNPQKGIYAQIFEEEYKKVIKKPKYSTLYQDIDLSLSAEEVHDGYFSKDKKGRYKNIKQKKNGEFSLTKDDESAFNLIMKDKERLLSFDSKLKFIFSHSALREGWDNPNVFQICTLNETSSNIKKRQEIGRGLRLCVNQEGERIHSRSKNTLTIMANESYEEFARGLQIEMEKETGIKFGNIEKLSFKHLSIIDKNGVEKEIGEQGSIEIFNCFKKMNYVDKDGRIQDALRAALRKGTVEVPERFVSIKEDIIRIASKQERGIKIKPADKKQKVQLNNHVYIKPEFKEFWDRIKQKTTFSVEFDSEVLIKNCSEALKEIDVKSPKLFYTKAGISIKSEGVTVDDEGKIMGLPIELGKQEIILPDIITFLQNETSLTRKTIITILKKSETLKEFKRNPQDYMEKALKIIKRELNHMLVDGIKYSLIDDYYAQELFESEEIFGYLYDEDDNKEGNMIKAEHSVYDYVVFDSANEMEFAKNLDGLENVELFTKLPNWFKISTPLGNYNPDWAILLNDNDGMEKMYFVVETKANIDSDSLRWLEKAKIDCGKEHFIALDSGVKFKEADNFKEFISGVKD